MKSGATFLINLDEILPEFKEELNNEKVFPIETIFDVEFQNCK